MKSNPLSRTRQYSTCEAFEKRVRQISNAFSEISTRMSRFVQRDEVFGPATTPGTDFQDSFVAGMYRSITFATTAASSHSHYPIVRRHSTNQIDCPMLHRLISRV